MTISVRLLGLLVAGLLFAPVQVAAQDAAVVSAPALSDLSLNAPDGREIPVFVFPAAEERAVIVFSHGLGGEPRAYQELIGRWTEAGFTVVAPLHVDSQRHPGGGRVPGALALMTRIADLSAVRAHVRERHMGKPMVAAGHSFGSLLSVIQGGALTAIGPNGDPDIRAVVAISTAGELQGLVLPDTYARLTVPLLVVTGDADTVGEYAPDWRAHRIPFDRSAPGDKMLIVFAGGDHSLVAEGSEAQRDFLASTSLDFLRAHGLGDEEARTRLAALAAPESVQIERR